MLWSHASHRLYWGKNVDRQFLSVSFEIFEFCFAEILKKQSSVITMNLVLIAYFDWLMGSDKWQMFDEILKTLLHRNRLGMKPVASVIYVHDISIFVSLFQLDKNADCHDNLCFPISIDL